MSQSQLKPCPAQPVSAGGWKWIRTSILKETIVTSPDGREWSIRDGDIAHPRVERLLEAMFDALKQGRQALATQPEPRPQNCGTGYCSCIECPYEATNPAPAASVSDAIARVAAFIEARSNSRVLDTDLICAIRGAELLLSDLRAILALRPAQAGVPITRQQLREEFHRQTRCTLGGDIHLAEKVAKVVEAFHHIAAAPTKEGGAA